MLTHARNLAGLVLFNVRMFLATGLLLLLTTFFGACGTAKDLYGPAPLYGPPPPKDGGVDSCLARALYGPLACQSDTDCAQWNGAGWYCDKANVFDDGCGKKSTWPVCKPSAKDAGPVKDGCEPVALYGPKPCQSDAECVTDHGAGWYCDKNNAFGNGCGGISTWPMCRPASTDAGVTRDGCQAMTLYGPPPCQSDADCAKWYDSTYTCNKSHTYNNGCGSTTWPICEKK